jgi:hypothetical protein
LESFGGRKEGGLEGNMSGAKGKGNGGLGEQEAGGQSAKHGGLPGVAVIPSRV